MLDPNFTPFPEIKTERLLLRRIVTDDLPALLFLRSDERVMQFIDKERTKNMEEAAALLKLIDDALTANDGITWAIELKTDPGNLAGTIGFWRILKQHHRAEIGYLLHPDHWNKGIMKEAIKVVIQYGFNTLHLHSIEAHINTGNDSSAALLEKTGFVREAYFKEDFYYDGIFRDTAVYSLLSNK